GGVNSPVRAFGAVGGNPPFIQSGKGALIKDIDGNEYLDYVGSWGPHILGHAHKDVVKAVKSAADLSTSFGAPTEAESDLAELVCSAFPAMDQVRFVNSGTEACMSAIRLARGFTGRDLIIKFAGCYHGHSDGLLVAAGSGALTFGKPSSAGVPAEIAKLTIVLPYNDVGAVEAAFKAQGKKIAAVIVEPVAGNMGAVRPERGYLESLRAITSKYGSLLIFDEVMTGFRLAWGGVQNLFEIAPDLTTLGKVVGGGLPLAAFGGRKEIMQKLAPVGPVYQAGTLSGNPLATAAGLASLRAIQAKPEFYQRLEVLSARLAFGLEQAIESIRADHPKFEGYVSRFGSMVTLFFGKGPVRDLDDAMACDAKRFGTFHAAMLARGVYLPASQFEAWFVSNAHTFKQIDATVGAAEDALRSLLKAKKVAKKRAK
ncbi:MAG: glutamate-1-semialdehyde 2,1-aminomutase, partial [Planctomycetes bacterium]|nr:glutamate-1-semialdehyde 2,1-aminomutase [Planctomycetota bacterium]